MSNSLHEGRLPKTASSAGSWNAAVIRAMRRHYERIRHQRQIHRDLDRLMELDDRALADIGVARGELLHITRHGRRRDASGGGAS